VVRSFDYPLNRSRVVLSTVWPGVSHPGRCLSTSYRDFRFALDGFHALLNSSSRCFSAFPYGTCSLSVTTLSYLALDGQHHPYSASTLKLTYSRGGTHRLPYSPGRVERPVPWVVSPCAACRVRVSFRPSDYRSRLPCGCLGFGLGLIPLHSQLLGESQLISFPPLTNMLKFSG
jgi:hypothetical protein